MAYTYNLKDIIFNVGGNAVTGFHGDDAVTITPNADSWNMNVGADGHVVRSRTNDKSAEITFNLSASSPLNEVFHQLHKDDKEDGSGVVDIYVRDRNTGAEHYGAECWVKAEPEVAYARDEPSKEWVWQVAELESTYGTATPLVNLP